MARIIYAVAGEGFGHSSRSHIIGQRLIDAGHNVMFVGSRKSLLYLKQYFSPPKADVKEVFGLSFAFEAGRAWPNSKWFDKLTIPSEVEGKGVWGPGRIDRYETLKRNLLKLPEVGRVNEQLFRKHFVPFEPDLVISDFEPFSAWWACLNRVPFISIDNEHMITLCKLEHQAKNWFSRITAGVVIKCHYVGAIAYIIVNFFKAPLRIDSAIIAPPIIRDVVGTLRPTQGEHILVYSTTGIGEEQLKQTLHKFDRHEFFVYGFDKSAEYKNCIFKKRSTEGFLADLASARAVIASAGFSLISECMHLKKRMLLLPIAGQYEQIINAHYVQKLGLGVYADKLNEKNLGRFLDELDPVRKETTGSCPASSRFSNGVDKPMQSDERILWPNNDRFFQILQGALNKLRKPIRI